MVKIMMAKVLLITTIGRKGFILQLLKVNILCLVNIEIIKRKGVGSSETVLTDDVTYGTIVEGKEITFSQLSGWNIGSPHPHDLGGFLPIVQ